MSNRQGINQYRFIMTTLYLISAATCFITIFVPVFTISILIAKETTWLFLIPLPLYNGESDWLDLVPASIIWRIIYTFVFLLGYLTIALESIWDVFGKERTYATRFRQMKDKFMIEKVYKALRFRFIFTCIYFILSLMFVFIINTDYPVRATTYTFIPVIVALVLFIMALSYKNRYEAFCQNNIGMADMNSSCSTQKNSVRSTVVKSTADEELLNYKILVDQGIISISEFSEKKKDILNREIERYKLLGNRISEADKIDLIRKYKILKDEAIIDDGEFQLLKSYLM